ncbi:hypothetical protein EVAR_99537_1 [Eumeta japonica]|uniref:Uncharacterized protein n=1 Tax=Eumeta variegata TaxID=151549 RepID=A0A4C1ZMJ6_EUMVA|nr:hypothetical protein EVAR_99537_1 [Eumeta japonica]
MRRVGYDSSLYVQPGLPLEKRAPEAAAAGTRPRSLCFDASEAVATEDWCLSHDNFFVEFPPVRLFHGVLNACAVMICIYMWFCGLGVFVL